MIIYFHQRIFVFSVVFIVFSVASIVFSVASIVLIVLKLASPVNCPQAGFGSFNCYEAIISILIAVCKLYAYDGFHAF